MVPQTFGFSQPTADVLPPHNVEAEEAILGGILLDPNAMAIVADALDPADFYTAGHQVIYTAAIALHRAGDPITLITMATALDAAGHLTAAGGRSRLAQLLDRTLTAANIDHHAALVREMSIARRALETAWRLQAQIQAGGSTPGDAIATAMDALGAIAEGQTEGARLRATVDAIAAMPTGYDRAAAIQAAAAAFNKHPAAIMTLVDAVVYEEQRQVDAATAAAALPDAIAARHATLPIMDLLHGDGGDLAARLLATARAMPTAPEHLVTALLPTLATPIGTSSRIVVNPASQHVEGCVLWALNIAPSGALKSPVLAAATIGLRTLEEIHGETYRLADEQWRALSREAQAETPRPIRKRHILTDSTPAARITGV